MPVVLFVDVTAKRQKNARIEQAQQVIGRGRQAAVNNHCAEIFDVSIHRVAQKQLLHGGAELVYLIKNCRKICEQGEKHIVQILHIPKEHIERGKYHAHPNVHGKQADNGKHQRQHVRAEGDAVERAENEIHAQRKPEVDKRRDVFREQEHILRHTDFCEDARIAHQAVHAAFGRLFIVRHHQVAAEQIGGIMRRVAPEKLSEHQPHHQQSEQGRKDAPCHAQRGALVLLFKVALDELFKKKLSF